MYGCRYVVPCPVCVQTIERGQTQQDDQVSCALQTEEAEVAMSCIISYFVLFVCRSGSGSDSDSGSGSDSGSNSGSDSSKEAEGENSDASASDYEPSHKVKSRKPPTK